MVMWLFMSFLSLQLSEFLQSEIKQKFPSVQKVTCITENANKKLISLFCVSRACGPHLSRLFKLNSFFSLALFANAIHNGREKKLTNNYI